MEAVRQRTSWRRIPELSGFLTARPRFRASREVNQNQKTDRADVEVEAGHEIEEVEDQDQDDAGQALGRGVTDLDIEVVAEVEM